MTGSASAQASENKIDPLADPCASGFYPVAAPLTWEAADVLELTDELSRRADQSLSLSCKLLRAARVRQVIRCRSIASVCHWERIAYLASSKPAP
jgi:hypothetical protein